MEEIKLVPDERARQAFVIEEDGERKAEMVFRETDGVLRVYHTEVDSDLEGKGVAKMLLLRMVEYARGKNMKIEPLCSYVHAQFERHPDEYKDVWKK
jgi:uncharacterized protein